MLKMAPKDPKLSQKRSPKKLHIPIYRDKENTPV